MSVHMKARRTRISKKKTIPREKGIPWREVAKDSIEKYTETGLMIRGGRFKAGLTQKQLADKLGILPHHISEMEHGKRAISKKMAHKLAEIMNVSYKVFL